jgi:hypothetical protein
LNRRLIAAALDLSIVGDLQQSEKTGPGISIKVEMREPDL